MKYRMIKRISALMTASLLTTGVISPVYAVDTGFVVSVKDEAVKDDEALMGDEAAEEYEAVIKDEAAKEDGAVTEDEVLSEYEDESASEWDGSIPEEYLTYNDVDLTVEESEIAKEALRRDALPSSYRSDSSVLPPIRNQSPFGACWTFLSMGACEGSLTSHGYASSSDIDLAERALCYFLYDLKGVDDPLGHTLLDYNEPDCAGKGAANIYQLGGNIKLAMFFLSNWGAIVSESRAPYQELANISVLTKGNDNRGDDVLDDSLCYDSDYHLQEARLIPQSDRDGIKRAIMENGIVGVSYYHVTGSIASYYNSQTHGYYTGTKYADKTNHAVCIVGWDDSFSVDNFNANSPAGVPNEPGAWLIRNSYGIDRFDSGYMWISYEDKSLNDVSMLTCEPKDNFDNNYFYDGSTGVSYLTSSNNEEWCAANVFTASGNEILRAVSIATKSTDVHYSVQVYKNPTDPANPVSGTPMLSTPVSGVTDYSGIYTIELGEDVHLAYGDVFSIVFTLEAEKAVFVERSGSSSSSGKTWIRYYAHTDPGQSFMLSSSSAVSVSGNSPWMDIHEAEGGMCFRIHAYTDDSKENIPSADKVDPIYMVTNYSDRLGDYEKDLFDALERFEPGAGSKWRFEDPDLRLTADDSHPMVSVNLISNKHGGGARGQVGIYVTGIGFKAFDGLPDSIYMDSGLNEIREEARYIGYDPGGKLSVRYSPSQNSVIRIISENGVNYIEPIGTGTVTLSADLLCDGERVEGIAPIVKTITVLEPTLELDRNVFDFNSSVSGSYDSAYITNCYSSEIESVTVEDAQGFNAEFIKEEGSRSGDVKITYSGAKMSRSINARLSIKLKKLEKPVLKDIRLNVRNIQPVLTVSTVAKVDHLYTSGSGDGCLMVAVNDGSIDRIELADNNRNGKTGGMNNPLAYKITQVTINADAGKAQISIAGNGQNMKWNKGQLKVWLKGLSDPVTKDITIGYIKSTLKANATGASVLTSGGMILDGNRIVIRVNNTTKKNVETFEDPAILITDASGSKLDARYVAKYEEGAFIITPKSADLSDKGEYIFINISDLRHSQVFKLDRFKITGRDVSKASLMLTKSEVTTYYYDDVSAEVINNGFTCNTTVKIKGCDGPVRPIIGKLSDPVAASDKSKALIDKGLLKIDVDRVSGDISLSYPAGKHPEAGTYRYNFIVSKDDIPGLKKDIKTTLTVRIKKLDINKARIAGASVKGKADVFDREEGIIEVVPKFNNVPADYTITGMELTGAQKDKFAVITLKDDPQKYRIRLTDNASVSTKTKYSVGIVYTLFTGGGELKVTVPDVKLSVTQSKPVLKTDAYIWFDSKKEAQSEPLKVSAYNKEGKRLSVKKLELNNPGKGISITDMGDGQCYVNYSPSGGLKPGASYTLKLKVYLNDSASDKDPINLNYKVNILK